MAVTDAQYERLLTRLTTLEDHHNDIAVALDALVTLTQVNQLVVTLQNSIAELAEQVEALEERIAAIESEPLE